MTAATTSRPKLAPTPTAKAGNADGHRAVAVAPELEAVRTGAVLARGQRGPAVAELQRRLNEATGSELAVDGNFGARTEAAVRAFQGAHGLTEDGMVGPGTLRAVDGVLARAGARPDDGVERSAARDRPLLAPRHAEGAPPPTTAAPRRGLRAPEAAATLPGVAGLSAPARTRFDEAMAKPAAAAPLQELLHNERYRGLPPATQTRLLETVVAPGGVLSMLTPGGSVATHANHISQLLSSPAANRLSANARTQLLELYAAHPSRALVRLAGVGGPERLTSVDAAGGTLLSSLHAIATGPLASGVNRALLVSSTIEEVADRTTIEQRQQGTCAATSVVLRLAAENPAEYARLVAGLATPGGRVNLRDGSTIARNVGSLADSRSQRTQSERLLQDSFMGFANGNLVYDVARDTNHGAGGGLNIAEVSRLQSSVFGERYRTTTTVGREITRDAGTLDRLWRNLRNNLDRATFRHDPNSPMVMLQQEIGRGRSAVIGMRWGETGHSAHAVVVTRIEGGRVYFENPHGNRSHGQAVGASLSPPPRRVEAGNVQSMTLAAFQQRMFAVSTRA